MLDLHTGHLNAAGQKGCKTRQKGSRNILRDSEGLNSFGTGASNVLSPPLAVATSSFNKEEPRRGKNRGERVLYDNLGSVVGIAQERKESGGARKTSWYQSLKVEDKEIKEEEGPADGTHNEQEDFGDQLNLTCQHVHKLFKHVHTIAAKIKEILQKAYNLSDPDERCGNVITA
ncbi:hypothetical protein M8J77_000545 [Diaphorina citri]|nr:hypothetical protein M8J77_000545 [Diaphorina citri]